MQKKWLRSLLFAYMIIGFSLLSPSFPLQQEGDFISSDPTEYRTGLLFENPEQDPQAIPGIQYFRIHRLDPNVKIAASHFNYSYLPPVNSQGGQGSCVAWAVGYYLKSYQENLENGRTSSAARSNPDNICSPAFIYNLIHVSGDGGSYYSDAFRMLNDFGCPSLTDMPYNDNDYQTWPDEDDFTNAIPRRTQATSGEYYYLYLGSDTELNQVKQMVQNGQLVVFGISVYYNYDHIGSYNNIYTIADLSGNNRGGHAQTIVGFDDSLVTNDGVGAFRVVNSWGSGWGDSGFYWISYEAIKAGSGISSGYAYWVDDRNNYSSQQTVVFELEHNFSRETSTWISVDGNEKEFFDFTVESLNQEYQSYPTSNIVLDIQDLQAYLTTGAELRLYMDDRLSNGSSGEIINFIYQNDAVGQQVTSLDTPVEVADNTQDYAGLIIPTPTAPVIQLSKSELTFGAIIGGGSTPSQTFNISNGGIDPLDWSITDNRTWLTATPTSGTNEGLITVSVDPSGLLAGNYSGIITVSSASAYNSPQQVNITLNVYAAGMDSGPFGSFDTPSAGATVSGNIPVTGWALDDVEVTRVIIKRSSDPDDPPGAIGPDGQVYIGEAVFVKGARPDVEAFYPDYPRADRAGWGYMMLTYGLPRNGNGTFTLYAIAEDSGGKTALLGSKQITSDNNSRVKPFGTIDTPGQGETIAGSHYINFGWALTPQPNMIPLDGSTIWVSIDGVFLGHPVYGQYREDIATSFPSYANYDTGAGHFIFDTTSYGNGVHSIGWLVTDDDGNTDGIGSRYFQIQNTGISGVTAIKNPSATYPTDTSGTLEISAQIHKKGHPSAWLPFQLRNNAEVSPMQEQSLPPPEEKHIRIEIAQQEGLVLKLFGIGGKQFIGWGKDIHHNLPIGSTLDKKQGIFYWIPGPGFLGRHTLHFAVTNGTHKSRPICVEVQILPKSYPKGSEKNKVFPSQGSKIAKHGLP